MSNILEAIEQVKNREAEAARLIDEAKQQAASFLVLAEEEGRRQYEVILHQARDNAAQQVGAGKAEAAGIRQRVDEASTEALRRLDQGAAGKIGGAVDHLLELFVRHYGPRREKG